MFTIKNFLDLDILPWYKNLTNSPLPESRPIEHVSVNDLPLDDFIRRNEMVISIATPYIKDICLMQEFIRGLIDSQASIFLLAIPGDELELDETCTKLATQGGLPVLLIPWDVRFADICETVLERLHADYNDAAEKMKQLQNSILKSFLDGADINAAARIISKTLQCNISIANSLGQVISGNRRHTDTTGIPLESGGHIYGFLYLEKEKTRKYLNLLSHTLSPLLSLWFYRDEIIESTQRMAKDDLIWGLANGSDPDSEKTKRTAKLMELNLNRTYACIIGRIGLKGHISDEGQQTWIDANIISIGEMFSKAAAKLKKEAMITHHNNAVITYLEVIPSKGKGQISDFLDIIESQLLSISKNLTFSWGISEIKEGATDFRNYYLHAKLAEELCSNDTRFIKRYYYENTLIYNMMSTLSSNDYFMAKAYDILEPILQYDRTKSTSLMDTLRVYLSCKNVAQTARKLDRHRQTLLYQLEKIEDLTGMSLKNNDEVFLLEVCMRLQVDFAESE